MATTVSSGGSETVLAGGTASGTAVLTSGIRTIARVPGFAAPVPAAG